MPNPSGQSRTPADKERSKQMSRPVSGPQAARQTGRNGARAGQGGPRRSDARAGGGRGTGGAQPQRRGGSRPAGRRQARRSPTALLTWGTAALVIVVVVVLVVVKVTGSSSPSSNPGWSPASATVTSELAHIPASVFNTVGIESSVATIYPPTVISGQKPLTLTSAGKTLPGVFFYGAEYCPHCAAERWVVVVAMDRFGTFKNLGNMTSASEDSPPSIATFSFLHATYSSRYVAFESDEAFSNQLNAAGTAYQNLQKPTASEIKLIDTYDTHTYFPGIPAGEEAFPLVDFGNKILSEENYAPNFLQGFSRDQIAAGLNNAKNPITQAIVASANYLTASICAIDGGQPSSVCLSKGVEAAAKSLGVTLS